MNDWMNEERTSKWADHARVVEFVDNDNKSKEKTFVLQVMDRDAKLMRQDGPTIFAQAKHMVGIPEIASLILESRQTATQNGAWAEKVRDQFNEHIHIMYWQTTDRNLNYYH